MDHQQPPYIAANENLPELTLKVICLSVILAVILAASNTYLALKIGMLTSASIPAAVLSMGILRLFKQANILENNLVQTAASAGEAVAGGIVFTVPALIIIHHWHAFNYWENLAIALTGGLLGVFFSIPLRKVLMTDRNLNYPEGRAIANILQLGQTKTIGFREMLLGSAAGALLEFAQSGLQIIASSIQKWFVCNKTLVGMGSGFSAALIGAGYLMGFRVGLSIFLGASIGWLVGIPVLSFHTQLANADTADTTAAVMNLYNQQLRYVGIGAMLTAGTFTLLTLFRPFYESMRATAKLMRPVSHPATIVRTEHDMPIQVVVLCIGLILAALYGLFKHLLQYQYLGLPSHYEPLFILSCLLYVLLIGFIFSAICGYFSGLVGVTASPGSAIVIAGLFLAAIILRITLPSDLSAKQLQIAAAITIILGTVITGAASIANDNIQDLKVGHLVGSTPWKQQVMLILGVFVAAAVIPPIMQLLFNVYGIADVLPHPHMDPSKTLAAPPAAMMATVVQAVFNHNLPWNRVIAGAILMLPIFLINHGLQRRPLSPLAVAIGIYLPLTTSMPLFFGAFFAWMSQRALAKQQSLADATHDQKKQRGVLLACGLVCGAALMDVALAIPFALMHSADALRVMPSSALQLANLLALISIMLLGFWFYRIIVVKK